MQAIYNRIVFAGIIFLLMAVSLITYRNLNQYMREVKMVRHSSAVIHELGELLSLVKDIEIGYRGFQLTRDIKFLEPYFSSVRAIEGRWAQLDSLVGKSTLQARRADTLRILVSRQRAIIQQLIGHHRGVTSSLDTAELTHLIAGRENMSKVRALVERMTQAEYIVLRQREADETDFRNITPINLLAFGLLAMGGATFLFIWVNEELATRRKTEKELQGHIIALRNEAAIREFTERSLRSVLESSLNGIMVFRSVRDENEVIVDFKCILSNSVGAGICSLEPAGLVGQKFTTLFPVHAHRSLFTRCEKAVESGEPQQFEYLISRDDHNRWFYITAVRLDDGVVTTMSDVTDQKEQMLRMEEHEFLLHEAESMVRMGSWSYSSRSEEMIWSDSLFKIMGRSRTTFLPRWDSFLDVVCEEDHASLERGLAQVVNLSRDFSFEFRICPAGEVTFVRLKGRPKFDVAGNYSGFIGTVEDITEQQVNAMSMKRRADDLVRSNEDLEQFAYVASHDLQEPLRKIRAFGSRLSDEYKDILPSQGRDYIQRMQRAAERMQVLIQDLLSFSRVTQDKSHLPVDLGKVLDATIDLLSPEIEKLKASVSVSSPLPVINGNEAQLSRLFQNLLSNALKFHHPDRPPRIEISAVETGPDELFQVYGHQVADGNYSRIVVKDNGIGFDEKYSEKIFDLFQRLHGRTAYDGSGIGLAICRKIVHHHGGIIAVSSEENVGSEFVIVLPVLQTTRRLTYQQQIK